MEHKDTLSRRQLSAMAFISLLSPTVRQLSGVPAKLAGSAVWLCPAAAAVPSALYALALCGLMKNRRPGEGPAELIVKSVGKIAGRAVCAVFGLWSVFYCGFLICSSGERLISSVYKYGSDSFFIVISLAVALIAALGSVRYLGRAAEAFLPMALAALGVVIAAALSSFRAENLLPVSIADAPNIAAGGLVLANLISMAADFAFLICFVKPEGGAVKSCFRWTGLLIFCMLSIEITVIGVLSAEISENVQYPFFLTARNSALFGVAERPESIVVALWVGMDFLFSASLLTVASEIFREIFGAKKRKLFVFFAAAGAAAVAFSLSGDAFFMKNAAALFVPTVNATLKFLLLPGVLVIGRLRRRI